MEASEVEVLRAYRDTFESVDGRVVLDDLRKAFGNRLSFTQDPYITAFREGQRDVLLRVEHLIAKTKDPAFIAKEEHDARSTGQYSFDGDYDTE